MQTNDTLSRHLDDSIVSGIIQIYSLANKLIQKKPNQIKNTKNLYGVVVSFKEQYFRGGRQFWDEFLRDEITEKLKALNIEPNLIPPENIFLLSIDEFDYLITFLSQHPEQTFNTVFSQVKEFETDPQSARFFFRDHLTRIAGGSSPRPDHLLKKISSVIGDVMTKKQKAP